MVVAFCAWVLLAGVYILLSGGTSADELVAALVCGALAALWGWALRAGPAQSFRFQPAALSAVGRSVLGVPTATLKVGFALARAVLGPVAGRIVTRPFLHGRRTNPTDAGRRAVVVLAASLAPDSFILRLPEQRDQVDIHSLAGSSPRSDARWPI